MKKTQKILIVEDERQIAEALRIKLNGSGFKAEVTLGGDAGLLKIKSGSYDLILLDLLMPGLDGYQVLSFMRKDGIKTPVFVLSNIAQEDEIERAMKLGARKFFVKAHTTLAELVAQITKFLAKK